MEKVSTEIVLLIACTVVIVSYLFSIFSAVVKVPSVLLLLIFGIALRFISDAQHWGITFPEQLTELFGTVGLVMIVLEAGLDLKLERSKIRLIRDSFIAALVIFVLSAAGIAVALHLLLHEDATRCIVYAIPLSIMSSSIVIPSLTHISENKKEFLVYEASFSDMLGIMLFNFFVQKEATSAGSGVAIGVFALQIIVAVLCSALFSALLFLILHKTKINIRFFLVFALLIILYEAGKMLKLPSLLIILVFGMLMRNWDLLRQIRYVRFFFLKEPVEDTTRFLHSITAESSFLIRTFFFVLFGFSINIQVLLQSQVIMIGSIIVMLLFITRFLYLRFFLKESVYPETFFIPRGLITILLFYKIPTSLQLQHFDKGILFYIILVTSVIMMLGVLFYKKEKEPVQVLEEAA
jgi:Kef-type K+ transport system membrane component KefB